MNTREAYNIWSEIYDTNSNKTRDLDKSASAIPRILTLLLTKSDG